MFSQRILTSDIYFFSFYNKAVFTLRFQPISHYFVFFIL